MKNFNKIDRDFGILFGLIFLIFFFYTSYERFGEDNSNLIFLVISIILFLIAFFAPYILRPLSIIWMKLGYSLSKIVSPLLMFLLYLIILIPTSIMIKIFNRNYINKKIDKSLKTYWEDRETNLNTKMKNQF